MSTANAQPQRALLEGIARRVMLERGFEPDFSPAALAELDAIAGASAPAEAATRDLRGLAWCSIDNDDSRDLDQLTVAETLPSGAVRIMVAIADVDALVKKQSALDEHPRQNTTSVYTAAQIFPMLPTQLSTDLTSLNFQADRLALVIDMVLGADGALTDSSLYRATVRNKAKLAYRSVGAWLEGRGPLPAAIAAVAGLEANLRLQDAAAQKLKALRHAHGALSLETIETHPIFDQDTLDRFEVDQPNRAKYLIEDFMIAANGVTARYLEAKAFPSVRRVLRTPKRWDGIVGLAAQQGQKLPPDPNAKALEGFLVWAKAAHPERFADLSLSVIKLLGAGEYVVEQPGGSVPGHFGLAVNDYAHATAPNRRFPDLLTQRLLKAALAGAAVPYSSAELDELAQHCTEKEDAARKVERQVAKSAAALLLQSRIGESFDAVVTGAADKGTWVRVARPPVEGRLAGDVRGVDVGQRLRVRLASTDVERGYIDFVKVKG